jgi:hypothetical protein
MARHPDGRSVAEAVALARENGLEEVSVVLAALTAALNGGDVEEARAHLDRLLAVEPRYLDMVRRLPGMADMLGLESAAPEM